LPPPVSFFYATSRNPIIERLRSYYLLPETTPMMVVLDVIEGLKFMPKSQEFTAENIRAFIEGFVSNKSTIVCEPIIDPEQFEGFY